MAGVWKPETAQTSTPAFPPDSRAELCDVEMSLESADLSKLGLKVTVKEVLLHVAFFVIFYFF